MKCLHCGEEGHTARVCSKPGDPTTTGPGGSSSSGASWRAAPARGAAGAAAAANAAAGLATAASLRGGAAEAGTGRSGFNGGCGERRHCCCTRPTGAGESE
ncbi:hypothetical protein EYF80_063206 [Liparis tanakae]|uniref:CCHC-type domain-containing protein n=1 Tax=Liparis tanakae TaxID=230148 RepID=A0A4Z2ED08_9TELE|nr:hypothetical protein EYF80_063206 [Liparis tanakae]